MKCHFGIIGLVVGVVAIGIAIFQEDIRARIAPPAPTPEEERSFKDLAVEASKKLIVEKILNKDEQEEKREEEGGGGLFSGADDRHDRIALIYTILGFAAMILGIISWIQKDHIRISGGAVALGLVAIAWQYVLIGAGIAVIIFILSFLNA